MEAKPIDLRKYFFHFVFAVPNAHHNFVLNLKIDSVDFRNKI
jgi:hypothetical protein